MPRRQICGRAALVWKFLQLSNKFRKKRISEKSENGKNDRRENMTDIGHCNKIYFSCDELCLLDMNFIKKEIYLANYFSHENNILRTFQSGAYK